MVGYKATAGYAGTRLRWGEKVERLMRKVTAGWKCARRQWKSVQSAYLRRFSDGSGAETRAPNPSWAYQALRTVLFCKSLFGSPLLRDPAFPAKTSEHSISASRIAAGVGGSGLAKQDAFGRAHLGDRGHREADRVDAA